MPIRLPIRAFVLAAAVAVSTVAAPAASAHAAQSCTWSLKLLPTPASMFVGFMGKGDGTGRVTGWGYDASGASVPLIWSDAGAVTRLPVPGIATHGRALDVNREGDVLLVTEPGEGQGLPESYVLRPGRKPVKLAGPAGGYTYAAGINDDGVIVGSAVVGEVTHAVSWTVTTPGRYTDLGQAYVPDISNNGALAGYSETTPDGHNQPLTGRVNTGLRPLPVTVPMRQTYALGAAGPYIVAYGYRQSDGQLQSFVWKNKQPTAQPLGFQGYAVNKNGVAAGSQGPSAAVAIDGVVTPLPRLDRPGDTGDVAKSVTDNGRRVFGQVLTSLDDTEPAVWTCA